MCVCVCVCVCAPARACVCARGWAGTCAGGVRFSNSNRIIPSDYRILHLLKMPIPNLYSGENVRDRGCEFQSLPPIKKINKSAVWEYFGYPKNDRGVVLEDGYPVCKKCGRRVAAKGGNTSNMFSHIREHHPSVKIKVSSIYSLRPYYFCHAEGIPESSHVIGVNYSIIQMPCKMCDLIDRWMNKKKYSGAVYQIVMCVSVNIHLKKTDIYCNSIFCMSLYE